MQEVRLSLNGFKRAQNVEQGDQSHGADTEKEL
jgi:hypothetical protein